jgi:tryptophanyl-tRNA synthetase
METPVEDTTIETAQATQKPIQQVVMSGMRPTGRLHLGHYIGVLKKWVDLQENYHC